MRYCQPHWDQLRAAIDAAGLGGLVAGSGEVAASDFALGRSDPLMTAHNMVVGRAVKWLGLEVMAGKTCPVCSLLELPDDRGRTRAELEVHYSTDLALYIAAYWSEGAEGPGGGA